MLSNLDLIQLVTGAGDAIVVCDAQGAITFWNRAAERIFGFTESEACGQSLDIIIPERQQQRHWRGYSQTMETGVTKYGAELLRVPALHKDGHTLSIAFTVSLLFSADHKVRRIVAIVRDETRRFAEERELRKRLAVLQTAAARAADNPGDCRQEQRMPESQSINAKSAEEQARARRMR